MSVAALRYASEFDSSGYAVAARRCIAALVGQEIDVSWEALEERVGIGRSRTPVAIGAPIELRARRRRNSPNELAVLHCVPQSWGRLREELSPSHVIGHVVWECEQMPSRWRDELRAADELWVPTEWNKSAFAEIFTGPIHVVPHIVDDRPGSAPPFDISSDRPVVAIVSAWDWRKRPDRTLEAALTAFAGDRDVVIVVKTTSVPVGWPGQQTLPIEQIARIVARHANPPAVMIATEEWTDAEMMGLFERADCFLSLTSSEGWGLGAFDAATRGTPVVITGYGGQVEWLGADHPGLIPYTLVPADHPDSTLFEAGMQWAEANMDDAIDLLRGVIRQTETTLLKRSTELATGLCRKFSSQRVGADLVGCLEIGFTNAMESRVSSPATSTERIRLLVLTPTRGTTIDGEYVDVVGAMRDDRTEIEVVIGIPNDTTMTSTFEDVCNDLRSSGIPARFEVISADNESAFRNRLLLSALHDHDWVLWLDASVTSIPDGLGARLRTVAADIMQPCLVNADGEALVSTASTDRGEVTLQDYRGNEVVDLHGIDPRFLFVRADCHRDGLVWPAFKYGMIDPRARLDPYTLGRREPGEIETEGLGLMAGALGYTVLGLPGTEIIHESSIHDSSIG